MSRILTFIIFILACNTARWRKLRNVKKYSYHVKSIELVFQEQCFYFYAQDTIDFVLILAKHKNKVKIEARIVIIID